MTPSELEYLRFVAKQLEEAIIILERANREADRDTEPPEQYNRTFSTSSRVPF